MNYVPPNPSSKLFNDLKVKLHQRLGDLIDARADKHFQPGDPLYRYENGYDAALSDEIEFLTELLAEFATDNSKK